jgi:hypothetical protein
MIEGDTTMRRAYPLLLIPALCAGVLAASSAPAQAPKNASPPPHGFFSRLVRVFARLERVHPARRTITFVTDADGATWTQPLKVDSDVFLNELPAEANALKPRERVWVAMEGNAAKKEFGVVHFICDEPTYQALHGTWYTVQSVDAGSRKVVLAHGEGAKAERVELTAAPDFELLAGSRKQDFAGLKAEMVVRFQSRYATGGYELTQAVSQLAWAFNKARQNEALEQSRVSTGLPGHVVAVDDNAWTVLIYRTGSEWARRLRRGDRVLLRLDNPSGSADFPAEVREIGPWGEKTRVLLQVNGGTQPAAETPVRLRMSRPEKSPLPAGLGIATDSAARIEWFLSTVYCTCGIAGDRCTGHLYTLSMCHPTGCGKPMAMRNVLADLIKQGLSDAQILKRLEADEGPELLVPHLLR